MFVGKFTKAFGLFIAVMFLVNMTFQTVPMGQEVIMPGSAMDADDQASLEENITDTIVSWIPFVVAMSFVGLALGYLGIRMRER